MNGFFFTLIWIACLLTTSATAETIIADSGLTGDIDAAIQSAHVGDTVIIPAGNWPFTGSIQIPRGIHLKGSGKIETVLYRVDDTKVAFEITTQDPFQISNLTLKGAGSEKLRNEVEGFIDFGILLKSASKDFRIFNCRFEGFSGAGIRVEGWHDPSGDEPRGVIDQNEFINLIYTDGKQARGYGVAAYGNNQPKPLELGTKEAIFIEDNYFERCRHVVASNSSAHYVFRHNHVHNNYYPWAAVDAHGKDVFNYGSRSYEIYENVIEGGVEWPSETEHGTWAIGLRGGDGVVFNNTFNHRKL